MQELKHDAHQNDRRNKMRGVGDHLDRTLEETLPHLIQTQCQNNRQRKTSYQRVEADDDGIHHHWVKFRRVDKAYKLIKPNPWAAPNTLHN